MEFYNTDMENKEQITLTMELMTREIISLRKELEKSNSRVKRLQSFVVGAANDLSEKRIDIAFIMAMTENCIEFLFDEGLLYDYWEGFSFGVKSEGDD